MSLCVLQTRSQIRKKGKLQQIRKKNKTLTSQSFLLSVELSIADGMHEMKTNAVAKQLNIICIGVSVCICNKKDK